MRDDRPTHLRLLLPAADRDANLCKLISSVGALGYPTPSVVGFDETHETEPSRIRDVLSYFNGLPPAADDDLIILLAGPQIWFQLRPETLVTRYFDIIRAQERRMRGQLGAAMDREKFQQRVIFAAQKTCSPMQPDDPACYAVPDSSLASNVYGPTNDKVVDDPADSHAKIRPKYLNIGAVIGPVGALRAIYDRVLTKAEATEVAPPPDEILFAEIFGEQEVQRHAARERHLSRVDRFKDWQAKKLGNYYNVLDPATAGSHRLMKAKPGTNYEFGIGLDYEMSLVRATAASEFDSEWVRFDDLPGMSRVSADLGVGKAKAVKLPRDITKTPPPFSTYYDHYLSEDGQTVKSTWANASLFTNMWTGSIPTMIYHNTERPELVSRVETHWNRTWYQQHLRKLLDLRVGEPARPVVTTEINGTQHSWWSETTVKQGAMMGPNSSGRVLGFDWLCQEEHEEVFRDGKGPWVDPRRFPNNDPAFLIDPPEKDRFNGDNDQ